MEAQLNLGMMYRQGKGVPQDYMEALSWYLKAAEQGSMKAQFNLGEMYCKGTGVPQDLVQALKWFGLAAIAGHEEAVKSMKTAEARMTPQEIGEAQALAQEWLAQH